MNDLLHEFERLSRVYGEHTFFCLQDDGPSITYSFAQANFASVALAQGLLRNGVQPGSIVACRMYNGPELVVASLAAAWGGFDLALVNPRFSDRQHQECLDELGSVALTLEEGDFTRLMLDACGMELSEIAQVSAGELAAKIDAGSLKDFAEERLEAFDPEACGVVMFATKGTAAPAAVPLTWARLTRSARQANEQLKVGKDTVWQLVLPLCGIDGFQVMVRSLMNATPFLLYSRYSTLRVLNDVLPLKVTHISVVATHLRELLECDHDAVLCEYQCILLGGAEPSGDLLRAADKAGAHLVMAHTVDADADLISRGHELGLDCTYDKDYIELVARN